MKSILVISVLFSFISCNKDCCDSPDLALDIRMLDNQGNDLLLLDSANVGVNRNELVIWYEVEVDGELSIVEKRQTQASFAYHESNYEVVTLGIYLNSNGPDSQHVTYVDWSPYDRDTIKAEFNEDKSRKAKIWYNGELHCEQESYDSCPTMVLIKDEDELRGN